MGFGRMLHRAMQYDVTNTVTGETGSFAIGTGPTDFGPDWSRGPYSGGMSLPGAWRASVLLSDLLGSVPWHAYRQAVDGPPEKVAPNPPLLDQPSPPDTRMTTWSSMALDLIWHGNAIALIAERNRHGWPTAILPVPADMVMVQRVAEGDGLPFGLGSVVYGVGQIPELDARSFRGYRWYSADDVVHVKGPARPGALRGMGAIENHLHGPLRLARELAEQAGGVADAAVPSVVIEPADPDITQTEADDLKASWMRAQRTRRPMVTNAKVEPIAWNPTETQLLEARKFSLHELALIFGVPMSFMGVAVEGGSMTYANIEQEGLNLIRYSLGGHLARFEQELSRHFPRGTWAKANLDALIRADTTTRYNAHEVAIRAGFLTRDEVRAIEDRPALTMAQREEMAPPPSTAPQSTEGSGGDDALTDDGDVAARASSWAAQLDERDRSAMNELEAYWKRGDGRAKWVGHPHPWTALYRHLTEHVGPERAKRIASQWFRDVHGYWPGERKGSNPVGRG